MTYLNKIMLSILLITAIPAYNFDTTVDYFKCLIFDECKQQEEA